MPLLIFSVIQQLFLCMSASIMLTKICPTEDVENNKFRLAVIEYQSPDVTRPSPGSWKSLLHGRITLGHLRIVSSSCVEFACSPRVSQGRYPHKKHAVILVSLLPPPGQPGCLMEGKGIGWNNVFLPRATSYRGNSLSGEKKLLGLLMHRRKHEVSLLLSPGWQRECSAQDYIRQLTLGEKWVTKSWDNDFKKQQRLQIFYF